MAYDFSDSSSNATTTTYDFGDGNTSTMPNPSHTYAAAGTYTVTLTVTNGCGMDTTTKVINVMVGVENSLNNAISIYPNPNNGQFKVELKGLNSSNMQVEVLDAMGRVVLSQTGSNVQDFDLNEATGLYFVRVTTDEGTAVSRVIVK